MGVDTVKKAADAFVRKQRRCLDQIEALDLFSVSAQVKVGVIASPINGHTFTNGGAYRLARVGETIQVIHGITPVGTVDKPSPSVLDKMRHACTCPIGRVATVYAKSGKAELQLE